MVPTETPITKLLGTIRARSTWLSNDESCVFLLHWRSETVEPFGGLLEAQVCLQSRLKVPVPMLLLGLPDENWVREVAPRYLPNRSLAYRVLDWPGLVYLDYLQTPNGLQSAFEAASAGVAAPVPEGMVHDTAPLLVALSDLHHLIIRNRQGALKKIREDFIKEKEVEGTEPLSSFYLAPTDVFDTEQRKMLERLWALDDIACIAAPTYRGLAALRETIEAFECRWGAFEQAKLRIATATNESARTSGLKDAISQIDSMESALTLVASRIDELRAVFEETDSP